MYTLTFDLDGKLSGASRTLGDGTQRSFVVGTREWQEFVTRNAAQPSPLVLADKPAPTPEELAAAIRSAAKQAIQSSNDDSAQRDRAIVLVLLDEINLLRQWITDFKAATAAASSLANLKTGVAALPNMPDRTGAQARTAIAGKLDGGQGEA